MAINKVDLASGETLIDLTNDSATESVVFEGATFHGSDGEPKTGTFTISEEITQQDSLIAQIKLALAGKAAGGGSEGLPTQEKTVNISVNGTHEVLPDDGFTLSKVKAVVNVPIPDGYIVPSGTMNITANGSYDVTEKAGVVVAVPDREIVLQDIEVTENGTYSADAGFDGIGQVTVNVAASGGGGNDLPAGYTRVDYIQFSGSQWIDTGIVGNQDTQVIANFTWESSTQRHLYGAASSDNKASMTAYMNGSWRFGDKVASKSVSSKNPMLPYSMLVNKTTIACTNSITSISGVANFETVGTLLLGACRDADGTVPGVGFLGKIFSFSLWQSDQLVQKLIPVVSDDGQYYFYDLVSQTLFGSITSTPLDGGSF